MLTELTLSDAPARPSEIAGWLGLECSTVSRNLDLLTQRSFVRAATTSSSGRTTRVAITDAGNQALADAEKSWRRAQAWISGAMGPDAVDALDDWLTALDLDRHRQ